MIWMFVKFDSNFDIKINVCVDGIRAENVGTISTMKRMKMYYSIGPEILENSSSAFVLLLFTYLTKKYLSIRTRY